MKPVIRMHFASSEKFSTMKPVNGGRLCRSCEAVIPDFTNMTDTELHQWFAAHKNQQICGHFRKDQVGVKLSRSERVYFHWRKKIENKFRSVMLRTILFALLLGVFTLAGCRGTKHVTGITSDENVRDFF